MEDGEMIAWVWALTGAGIGGTAWCLARPRQRSVGAAGPATIIASAACGAFFGLFATRGMPVLLLLALSWFTVVAVVLAGLDLVERRLPNRVLLIGYIGTGAGLAAEAVTAGESAVLLRALVAGATAFAFLGVLYAAAPGQLGGGDVKLAGLLGLMLGWLGWGTMLAGLWAGLILAAGGAVHHRVRRVPGTGLPLGAYLVAGSLVVAVL